MILWGFKFDSAKCFEIQVKNAKFGLSLSSEVREPKFFGCVLVQLENLDLSCVSDTEAF